LLILVMLHYNRLALGLPGRKNPVCVFVYIRIT